MTVGLPGAGIGGLFYLLAGLLMPVREAWLTVVGRSSRRRWRTVLQQFSISGGIAGGTYASGWLLSAVLGALARGQAATGASSGASPVLRHTADWLRPTHGLVQLATLAAIVALTWVLGALLGRGAPEESVAATAPALERRPTPRTAHDLRIPTSPPWRARGARRDDAA
jgi:hypothetical protein